MNGKGPVLWGISLLGLAGLVATYFVAGPERFWVNWLLWFVFLATVGLGALFLVAIEHLTSARWSVPLRRVAERVGSLVLLAAPIGVFLLLSIPVLYPWARPEGLENPLVAGKAAWLNRGFFSIRAVACLGLWGLSWWALAWTSLRQDRTRDPALTVRMRRFAPAFLALFALTITLLAFDWISSLEPEWYSDIFGVYVFAGSFIAGLAVTSLGAIWLLRKGRLPGVGPAHLWSLGGFTFAFTVFWSYIGFAQYMLMWYANLPEEVFWYKARIEGAYLWMALAIAALHFVIPFFALVPRDVKGDPKRLRLVAILFLVGHYLDLYWLIFPALRKGLLLGWPEAAFALFFVGLSLLWIRQAMAKGEDMPVGDPFLKEGLEFQL